MSLNFASATTDVSLASDASMDNLDPMTLLLWYKLTASTNHWLVAKGSGDEFRVLIRNDEVVRFTRERATTELAYFSSTAALVLGQWNFIAITMDTSASAGNLVQLYFGDLTTLAVETVYSQETDGSGSISDDSSAGFNIGGQPANASADGDIAVAAIFNRVLTLAECHAWQFKPRSLPGIVWGSWLGANGTGTQQDFSGNGITGTVGAGITQSPNVPLGHPFLFGDEPITFAAAAGVADAALLAMWSFSPLWLPNGGVGQADRQQMMWAARSPLWATPGGGLTPGGLGLMGVGI